MNLSEEVITASVERPCADYGALVRPPPECLDESDSHSFRLPLSLVNLSLTDWFIIASFIFVTVMLTSLCCIFFWWKRKNYMEKKAKKAIEELNNQKRQRSVSVIHHTTPAICSDNIISFVLPTHNSKRDLEAPRSVGAPSSIGGKMQYLLPPSSPSPRRSPSLPCLTVNELNLQLYTPGQETNEEAHLSRPKIGVSLQYDPSRQQLILKVLGALNLPCKMKQTPPDPFVKVTILPDKIFKCSTRTLRSNCNPLFNQTFYLDLTEIQLEESQLCLKVRDRSYENRSGLRSATLCQAIINLSDLRRADSRRQVRWCFLEDPPSKKGSTSSNVGNKGEMLISLSYTPDHNRMVLELLQIKDLPCPSNVGHEKVVVKLMLYERGLQIANRRTKGIRRDEISTSLRSKFVFTLQHKTLHESSCQIILYTKSKIGTKKTIGRIYLGHRHFFSASADSTASTSGIDHWHDMSHRPDIAIERWHPLL